MKDGVATSQKFVCCLALGLGLGVRQAYLNGKSHLPDSHIALPGWYFVLSTEKKGEDLVGSFLHFGVLPWILLSQRRCRKKNFLLFLHASHTHLQTGPHFGKCTCSDPALQDALQVSYPSATLAGIDNSLFLKQNIFLPYTSLRDQIHYSKRESRAGWLCYSLFTFQWKQNYCKDLTLLIAAYACKAEGQKTSLLTIPLVQQQHKQSTYGVPEIP